MSWGTTYKHEEYISRIGKNQLEGELESRKESNRRIFTEILAYMAQTPPPYAKYDTDEEYPWAEFISGKLMEYQEELMANYRMICRIEQCLEVMKEHPEDVEEG